MSQDKEEIIKSALGRMQVLCSKSEKCSGDIKEKLNAYPINDEEKTGIIESLKKDKFIDDKRYSNFYCSDKFKFNQWGKIKIHQALRIKGIEKAVIDESLSLIDKDNYFKVILHLAKEKNRQIKDKNIYSRKGKLFRFLGSKGFESELVYKAIDEIV